MGRGHLLGALKGIKEIRLQGSQVLAETWPALTSDMIRLSLSLLQ